MHIPAECNRTGFVSNYKNAGVGFFFQDILPSVFEIGFDINILLKVALFLWNQKQDIFHIEKITVPVNHLSLPP